MGKTAEIGKDLKETVDRMGTVLNAAEGTVKKENADTELFNKLHEARVKLSFMTQAVMDTLNNGHSIYGDDVYWGCKMIMMNIEDDLDNILKMMDKEYKPEREG